MVEPPGLLARLQDQFRSLPDTDFFSTSRAGLLELSYAIEDGASGGRLHAGFQLVSRFLPQLERYVKLAERVPSIHVFATPDVPWPELPPEIISHDLDRATDLSRCWFVITGGGSVESVLFAVQADGPLGAGRPTFQGAWSSDPRVAIDVEAALSTAANLAAVPPSAQSVPSDQAAGIRSIVQRLTARLDAASGRERAVSKQREELAKMVVHDLRNPLGVALGFVDLVLERAKPRGDAKDVRQLGLARDAIGEAIQLSGDVLSSYRLKQGLAVDRRDVDVSELLRIAAGRVAADALRRGILLEVVGPPTVFGLDPDLLQRYAINMFTNAIRHSHSRVEAVVCLEGSTLALEFGDDGDGVPQDERAGLFEPLTQGSGTRGQVGLGLAFCREVATAHGGVLSYRDRDGGGALFRLLLPAPTPEATPVSG